jgi:5-methylcytosine-specific restriction endonuclease McrA
VCGCAAQSVDHIDFNPANNARDNLQALCLSCHGRKTILDVRERRALTSPFIS